MNKLKSDFDSILSYAIESVKPAALFKRNITRNESLITLNDKTFSLNDYKKIYVIGAGKAAASMAVEIEKLIHEKITGGIVITKYGHSLPTVKIKVFEAGHPVIDENGINATNKIIDLISNLEEEDLVICLVSGGASALMELLPDSIDLKSLREINQLLLKSGADIEEINTVRKSLSLIKGGRILEKTFPATTISLIISDVIGDSITTIASGLTQPEIPDYSKALKSLSKYSLQNKVPGSILKYLTNKRENEGGIVEYSPEKLYNFIIGNNDDVIWYAENKAVELGYNVILFHDKLKNEARNSAFEFTTSVKQLLGKNEYKLPLCFITGGETTVTVKGSGKGGRNQEFTLACLQAFGSSNNDFILGSIGTDGTDGETDAAGAFITNETFDAIYKIGISPQPFLENNDSYNFFKRVNGLIKTGPTYTNVMDIVILLIA
ncbi:MAG TPA: DUF4147 domain-containing protein [Ignavibacteriaceae bacterium]|nr:DUF4147 domain-containing protein [Ignavibacteriaceae bacterium]